jgi:hypothetical protein
MHTLTLPYGSNAHATLKMHSLCRVGTLQQREDHLLQMHLRHKPDLIKQTAPKLMPSIPKVELPNRLGRQCNRNLERGTCFLKHRQTAEQPRAVH